MTKDLKWVVIRNQLVYSAGFTSKPDVHWNMLVPVGIVQAIVNICLQCTPVLLICPSISLVQFEVLRILLP